MAMNDISMLAVSERDAYFTKKQSSDSKHDSASDDFSDQLERANTVLDKYAPSSMITVTEESQEKLIPLPNEESSHTRDNNSDNLEDHTLLAHINAAHSMDTSVNTSVNSFGKSDAEALDKATLLIKDKPEDKLAPIIINLPNGAGGALDEALNDDIAIVDVDGKTNTAQLINTAFTDKTNGKAQTSEKMLEHTQSQNVSITDENSTAKHGSTLLVHSINEEKIAVNAPTLSLLAKDIAAVKSDKVFSSLTSEQQEALLVKLNAVSSYANTDKEAVLKQLLTQFITDNEKEAAPTTHREINSQIHALSTSDKHVLLNQLQQYIKHEPLSKKEQSLLLQTVSDLKVAINTDTVTATEAKLAPTVLVGDVNAAAQKNSQSSNFKVEIQPVDTGFSIKSENNVEKLLETPQKDVLRGINAEQLPPRVAQLFTQITNLFDSQQSNSFIKHDALGYEQAIIDAQNLQAGLLQNTAHAKQISADPVMLQALNIIKSDAAKMLQERVSAMLSINNKEAEVRLDPPEMGSMHIRIRSDAEQAQINFVVQNQQAKEALEQSMPRLRELLMQQGLELGESTISYGDSGKESAQQHEKDEKAPLSVGETNNDAQNEQPDKQMPASGQETLSSIDYYA